jgi:dienelactone hydrolase
MPLEPTTLGPADHAEIQLMYRGIGAVGQCMTGHHAFLFGNQPDPLRQALAQLQVSAPVACPNGGVTLSRFELRVARMLAHLRHR